MSRSRGYCFTINNFDDDDISGVLDMAEFAVYVIAAFEHLNSGTPHIQGYVYFSDAKTTKTLSKRWLRRAYITVARATGDKAFRRAEYCREPEPGEVLDFWEVGREPTPGRIGKDNLEHIIANPYENIHLYNQYRKMHRELRLVKPKEHPRVIRLISYDDKYTLDGDICYDEDAYDGEDIIVVDKYSGFIKPWINKHPPKNRRGYEIITIDPSICYICYETQKEKDGLELKYCEYIEYGFEEDMSEETEIWAKKENEFDSEDSESSEC